MASEMGWEVSNLSASEARYPSVFALSVVFGGTVGLTAFSMLGLSGGAGFVLGFATCFLVLASAVLSARTRAETVLLNQMALSRSQWFNRVAEDLAGLESLRREERFTKEEDIHRVIEELEANLQQAQRLSSALHAYRLVNRERFSDRAVHWAAVSAALITSLQLSMQLIRDMTEQRRD